VQMLAFVGHQMDQQHRLAAASGDRCWAWGAHPCTVPQPLLPAQRTPKDRLLPAKCISLLTCLSLVESCLAELWHLALIRWMVLPETAGVDLPTTSPLWQLLHSTLLYTVPSRSDILRPEKRWIDFKWWSSSVLRTSSVKRPWYWWWQSADDAYRAVAKCLSLVN